MVSINCFSKYINNVNDEFFNNIIIIFTVTLKIISNKFVFIPENFPFEMEGIAE